MFRRVHAYGFILPEGPFVTGKCTSGYNAHVLQRSFMAFLLLILVTACNSTPVKVKPVVDVISPPDGARYAPGERITLRVAAASSSQVARIEVHLDGSLAVAQDNPSPGPTYTALLQFVPSQTGPIRLAITALDSSGQSSDPVNLTLIVGVVSILDAAITATPATVSVPGQAPGPSDCKLGAMFVSDVTIPDNTEVKGGAGFVKTWRIRNTSLCAWETGYELAYAEGDQMGAPASVPVPPTARDAAVDISVPFTAPVTSGLYTSTWRMRNQSGLPFGNRVFVVIRVS